MASKQQAEDFIIKLEKILLKIHPDASRMKQKTLHNELYTIPFEIFIKYFQFSKIK